MITVSKEGKGDKWINMVLSGDVTRGVGNSKTIRRKIIKLRKDVAPLRPMMLPTENK